MGVGVGDTGWVRDRGSVKVRVRSGIRGRVGGQTDDII